MLFPERSEGVLGREVDREVDNSGAVLRTFMECTGTMPEQQPNYFMGIFGLVRRTITEPQQSPQSNGRAKSIGNHFERSAERVRAQSRYKFGKKKFAPLAERSSEARMPRGILNEWLFSLTLELPRGGLRGPPPSDFFPRR